MCLWVMPPIRIKKPHDVRSDKDIVPLRHIFQTITCHMSKKEMKKKKKKKERMLEEEEVGNVTDCSFKYFLRFPQCCIEVVDL